MIPIRTPRLSLIPTPRPIPIRTPTRILLPIRAPMRVREATTPCRRRVTAGMHLPSPWASLPFSALSSASSWQGVTTNSFADCGDGASALCLPRPGPVVAERGHPSASVCCGQAAVCDGQRAHDQHARVLARANQEACQRARCRARRRLAGAYTTTRGFRASGSLSSYRYIYGRGFSLRQALGELREGTT